MLHFPSIFNLCFRASGTVLLTDWYISTYQCSENQHLGLTEFTPAPISQYRNEALRSGGVQLSRGDDVN